MSLTHKDTMIKDVGGGDQGKHPGKPAGLLDDTYRNSPRKDRARTRILSIAIVSVLSFAGISTLGLVQAASASSTISGQITCVANPPQGAWLTANSGGSGWVNWSRESGTNTINYSKSLPNGGSWYLAVGCGGSTAHWGVTAYTNTYSGAGEYNFTCYDVRNAGYAYLRCQLA